MNSGKSQRPDRRAWVESFESRLLLAGVPRQMEYLDRGVIATRSSATQVFVSWRSLATDQAGVGFNVYRQTGNGAAVKINPTPLTGGTNLTDTSATLSSPNTYTVKTVVNGVEQLTDGGYTLPANSPTGPLVQIPLRNIGNYSIRHMSVADLDGDGKYDYIVDRYSNDVTNEVAALPQVIEAYKSDGTFLWSVDCGPNSLDFDNIEPGSSAIDTGNWDGVTAYDLDGDGLAEVLYRSANGVKFGDGKTLATVGGNNNIQFISVIDGRTGAERARIQLPNDFVQDGPLAASFAIGYLDGVHPSLIAKMKNRVGDGNFNQMFVAYDYNGTAITQRWQYVTAVVDSDNGHNIRIIDVDGDGRDELADTAQVIDDDGTLLYNMRYSNVSLGHGDRFVIGDLDPDRPGLEGYGVQQNNPAFVTEAYWDAATGEVLHAHYATSLVDVGRGQAGDIDPTRRGYEYWSFSGIYNSSTPVAGQAPVETKVADEPNRPWPNFRVWWDGDVGSEDLNNTVINKWNPTTQTNGRLTTLYNFGSPTATSGEAPIFYGDIFGDWREEVIFEKSDHTAINIYTTQYSSAMRLYALTQNPEYRNSITAKGYLQSNMVDYFLGYGMTTPPTPNIAVLASGKSAPTFTTKAAASVNPVTGKTVGLSVLGADDGGESGLSYTWSVTNMTGGTTEPVSFSINGTNAAKNAVATFTAAGQYVFSVTIRDATGKTASSSVTVTVGQTLTRIKVSPPSAVIGINSNQQFVATGFDQFGNAIEAALPFDWSVQSGGGTIDSDGNYTPPSSAGGAVVQVASGLVSASAGIAFSGSALAAPVGVSAAAMSASQINLTWTDSVVGETGFVIESSTDGVRYSPIATTAANSTSHRITGLNSDRLYYFRIRTLSANGTGPASAAVNARTFVVPIAWWKLDEATGTAAADATPNRRDAVTRSGPTWTAGKLGNGLSFDGVDDYVELPNDLVSTAAGSVSMWVKTSKNFTSDAMLFYMSADTYGNGGGSQPELQINFTAQERINLYIRGSASGLWSDDVFLTSASSYANNAWHHVAATWDSAGVACLYVDGVLVGSVAQHPVFTFGNSQRTFLSRTANNTNPFTGQMDDVRLFTAPLTAGQVSQLAGANDAPSVTTSAAATPNPVISPTTTATLSVLGNDDAGAANLIYTWNLVGLPPAPVTYSANGTNVAKTTVATFTEPGIYVFQVNITDAAGQSASSLVQVNVSPTLVSAVSRKGAGQDVPLSLSSSTPTLEHRAGGPSQLVMTFTEPVQAIDGLLSANEFVLANAQFQSATVSGVTLTLTLANVVNASRVGVTMQGLSNAAGLAVAGNLSMTIRALAGDADRNGVVNFNDFLAVQNAFGATASGVTATDFNSDGVTDFTDFLLLQNGFGQQVN